MTLPRQKMEYQSLQNSELSSGHLPVKLSTKEVEQNPEFVCLLQRLEQLLTPDVVSADVHKDLKQAHETLRHEKHIWLQAHILHHELQEIIMDYELRSHDTSLSTADREFKELLEQSLNYAEAETYLSFPPEPFSSVTLFGLTSSDIQTNNPYKKHIPSLQQKLIPELEERLRRRCENLVSVYHTSTLTDSDDLALAKASQLPALVERSVRIVEEESQQLRVVREKREKQFWLYFQTLLDSLSILEKMVNQYRLGKQSQNTNVTTEFLVMRCKAISLKIKYVGMQILCDTYTAETVATLTKIKDHLREATEMKEKALNRVNLALKAYAAVGFGFDELVDEYGKLMRELENKEWAVEELGKSAKDVDWADKDSEKSATDVDWADKDSEKSATDVDWADKDSEKSATDVD